MSRRSSHVVRRKQIRRQPSATPLTSSVQVQDDPSVDVPRTTCSDAEDTVLQGKIPKDGQEGNLQAPANNEGVLNDFYKINI